MGDTEMPPATTFGELDIQLRVMRADIHRLVTAMSNMATREDIAALSRKFDAYATHEDMRALRTDFELLRQRVEDGSVRSNLERWGTLAKHAVTIVTLVVASSYFIIALVEKAAK